MPVLLKDKTCIELVPILDCGFQSDFQLVPFHIVNDAAGDSQGNTNDGEESGLLEDADHSQDKADEANDGTDDSDQRNQSQ